MNLVPIWPLDGGLVSMELWVRARPRDGVVRALRMSLICAVVLILYSVITHFDLIPELAGIFFGYHPGLFMVIILVMLAFANYQHLQALGRPRSYFDDDRPPRRR